MISVIIKLVISLILGVLCVGGVYIVWTLVTKSAEDDVNFDDSYDDEDKSVSYRIKQLLGYMWNERSKFLPYMIGIGMFIFAMMILFN